LSAITSAQAMSSSASVAAPLPLGLLPRPPLLLMYQFIRMVPFQVWASEYFHRSSNSGWSFMYTAIVMP
jgi:hypothetical protein